MLSNRDLVSQTPEGTDAPLPNVYLGEAVISLVDLDYPALTAEGVEKGRFYHQRFFWKDSCLRPIWVSLRLIALDRGHSLGRMAYSVSCFCQTVYLFASYDRPACYPHLSSIRRSQLFLFLDHRCGIPYLGAPLPLKADIRGRPCFDGVLPIPFE